MRAGGGTHTHTHVQEERIYQSKYCPSLKQEPVTKEFSQSDPLLRFLSRMKRLTLPSPLWLPEKGDDAVWPFLSASLKRKDGFSLFLRVPVHHGGEGRLEVLVYGSGNWW